MRDDIIEIICEINPLWDPDDEDMSIAEFLESKQLMELIVTLEDKFDIDIPYDERNEDNFDTVDTIIALLDSLEYRKRIEKSSWHISCFFYIIFMYYLD